jgi:aminopeptidase N
MPSLTRDEAASRAARLRVHNYEVELDFRDAEQAAGFESTTIIRFSCTGEDRDTFVELTPAAVHEVSLNGTKLDPDLLRDNRIPLAGLGTDNEVRVRARMPYSNSGEGVHWFVDPADGEIYLYAMAGPDNAKRIFACFDQPDLKARIAVTVLAHPDWTVRANATGTQVARGRWAFAATAPLSPYLMTVVAGGFHGREQVHDGIALGLLCRRSMAAHLDKDADEIFTLTAACLDRYHELFAIRYPFGKYDQAFVAEFNWGAVENPGLVIFRDDAFIFRSVVTAPQRQQRAVVIAHEMAHMWFGDLVTLRWWDDIWLNEAFAEYMGWRVAAEATPFRDAWATFAMRRKRNGYAADQRPSTHPVAPTDVEDTAHALANFDGISYVKGASVLRQLAVWLGDEAFLAGVRDYCTRHAYGNATLADLLTALSGASGRDVSGWAEVWLRRAQVNTLRPEVTLDQHGRYARVLVRQSAPGGYPTLRPHRIGVGIYDGQPAALRYRTELDLAPGSAGGVTTVDALVGHRPGQLLLLNDGDLTFAKIRLDEASLARLPAVLPTLSDSLARAVLWTALGDALRDGELAAARYLELTVAALPDEPDLAIFEELAEYARFVVADCYLDPVRRPAALTALAGACLSTLAGAAPGSGRQLAAARAFISASTDAGMLGGWLAGRDVPGGLEVDPELRWALLYRLVVLGDADTDQVRDELARDASALGAQHGARCLAAVGDARSKQRAWQLIAGGDAYSARLVAATAEGFFQPEQAGLTEPYVARYFAEMPAAAARRTPYAVQLVARAGYPRFAVAESTNAAATAMLAREDLDPTLRRAVVDATDDLVRALAVRAAGEPPAG